MPFHGSSEPSLKFIAFQKVHTVCWLCRLNLHFEYHNVPLTGFALLHDLVSTGFNAAVNSQQLFSTIVTAIQEVEQQAKTSSSERQSIKDIRKKAGTANAAEEGPSS